jgi:hypothetical protein
MRKILRAGVGVIALMGVGGGALADCYDVFGCTDRARFRLSDLMSGPNCEFLYVMRNQIYAQHGYCFQTPRAIATFGNAGCVSSNANALGLSAIELANASTILQAEQAKGCPE